MGKSSGARPKKAVAEEVAYLREELSKLTANEWQRAYILYGKIVELCEHRGPMGGNPNPRACGYCGFFGHTRQFCNKRKEDAIKQEEREQQALRTEQDGLRQTIAEAWLEDPKRMADLQNLHWRYDRAIDEGGCKGCLRAVEGDWPCNECEECVKFHFWFNKP